VVVHPLRTCGRLHNKGRLQEVDQGLWVGPRGVGDPQLQARSSARSLEGRSNGTSNPGSLQVVLGLDGDQVLVPRRGIEVGYDGHVQTVEGLGPLEDGKGLMSSVWGSCARGHRHGVLWPERVWPYRVSVGDGDDGGAGVPAKSILEHFRGFKTIFVSCVGDRGGDLRYFAGVADVYVSGICYLVCVSH
jgi:hypothetical protein